MFKYMVLLKCSGGGRGAGSSRWCAFQCRSLPPAGIGAVVPLHLLIGCCCVGGPCLGSLCAWHLDYRKQAPTGITRLALWCYVLAHVFGFGPSGMIPVVLQCELDVPTWVSDTCGLYLSWDTLLLESVALRLGAALQDGSRTTTGEC